MLLNLLKRIQPLQISIAGFDGFSESINENYADETYQNQRHAHEFAELNKEIAIMFNDIVETMSPGCEFKFITPSIFEK